MTKTRTLRDRVQHALDRHRMLRSYRLEIARLNDLGGPDCHGRTYFAARLRRPEVADAGRVFGYATRSGVIIQDWVVL